MKKVRRERVQTKQFLVVIHRVKVVEPWTRKKKYFLALSVPERGIRMMEINTTTWCFRRKKKENLSSLGYIFNTVFSSKPSPLIFQQLARLQSCFIFRRLFAASAAKKNFYDEITLEFSFSVLYILLTELINVIIKKIPLLWWTVCSGTCAGIVSASQIFDNFVKIIG